MKEQEPTTTFLVVVEPMGTCYIRLNDFLYAGKILYFEILKCQEGSKLSN